MAAVYWMVGTLLSFSLMAIGVRELGDRISPFEMLFFRSLIGLAVIVFIVFYHRQQRLLKTERAALQFGRNLMNFLGQYCWFLGITLLPLAEVFALEFTVPLWTLMIACVFLGEKLTRVKLASLGLGLLGVIAIIQPTTAVFNPASLIVLLAAVSFAASYVATKSLSLTESPITILFYMSLIQLPISLVLMLPDWQTPQGGEWLYLLIVGLTGLSAHYCIAKAMQYADASVVVTLDFLRLPLIAVVGMLFYGEAVELAVMAGGLLMVVGNIINVRASNKRVSLDKAATES
ncbi:DMT family transporter [Photobacterium sp. OFAV2-7]|uniref:DMT family transporter n=1 Tax=Photobacterium sp. OFAV2-7 TaxID=2917748 RepID=UPI001EF4BD3C|nr:DMT family transporter [Photobacterium sp. OFAV2-7]MCG7585003.1 DMT family transporter [Photobacterium sp. OFAV2-7]